MADNIIPVVTDQAQAFADLTESRKTVAIVPAGAAPTPATAPSGRTVYDNGADGLGVGAGMTPTAAGAATARNMVSTGLLPVEVPVAPPPPAAPAPIDLKTQAPPAPVVPVKAQIAEGSGKTTSGVTVAAKEAAASPMKGIADAFKGLADDYANIQLFDVYKIPEASRVIIACPKKNNLSVAALLIEPISFTMESKWDRKAIGSLADSSLRLVDNVTQMFAGVTVNQPILNRRAWGGTSPLGMSVKVRLQAQVSAYSDVYLPTITLATFLQPRLLKTETRLDGLLSMFAVPGPSPFGGSVATAFKILEDPDSGGDEVSIRVGNLVNLSKCYLTKMVVFFSKTLDPQGFPESAELTITYGSMDTPFYISSDTDFDPVNLTNNNVLYDTSHKYTAGAETEVKKYLATLKEPVTAALSSYQDGLKKALTPRDPLAPATEPPN